MEDPTIAEPERDVAVVADEIAATQVRFRDLRSCILLLVRVPRDEPSRPPVSHVDEAGAIDAPLGHAAPLVARAEIPARRLDRIAAGRGRQPPIVRRAAQHVFAHPPRIVVSRRYARPAVLDRLHLQRLPPQGLRHLLGVVARLPPHRGYLDRTASPAAAHTCRAAAWPG